MRSRKLLALIFSLLAIAPALAGYMTLLGAGVGSIQPVVSWVSTTDPTFPSSSLSFSRTSNATMFDSTGKLTYAPNQINDYSTTTTQWINAAGATWSGNTLTANAGAGFHYKTRALGNPSTTNAIGLFDIKYVNNTWAYVPFPNDAHLNYVNLQTGAFGTMSSGVTGVSSTLQANGSYRFVFKYSGAVLSATQAGVGFASADTVGSFTAAGTEQMIVYRGMVSAVTYETAARSQDFIDTSGSAYYGPRIDYDPNTLAVKGLLIEEARTNLLVNSKSDGTNLATQNVTVTAQPYTLTFYGTGSVTLSGASTSGPLSGSGAFPTRSTLTFTPSAGTLTLTVAGTVQYAQLEAGSFATSYIPTAAASVTRAADVVQFTGAALTALQGSAGSAITETISLSDTSPASITNLIRGTNSILYRDTTGKTGTTNGTTALLTAAAPTWNVSLRNGLAWSAAGRSLVYTSGAVATDANAVSNGGTLYLGSNNGSAVENGWYKSFAIYNQRLPDATLQAKSVVGASYAANDNGIRYAFADNDNLPIHWRVAL